MANTEFKMDDVWCPCGGRGFLHEGNTEKCVRCDRVMRPGNGPVTPEERIETLEVQLGMTMLELNRLQVKLGGIANAILE